MIRKDPFSPKEARIAFLIVQGKSAKEIALDLDISPKTAEHHIANIKHKIEVRKKSELIQTLYEMGFKPHERSLKPT